MWTESGQPHGAEYLGREDRDQGLGSGGAEVVARCVAWLLVILTFPLCLFFCLKVVQEYEKALVFSHGKLKGDGASGLFFILPCIETYTKVDTRSTVFKIPSQEVLTKDSVTVTVDAVLYYRVSNAVLAVTNVADAHGSARLLGQTTLRGVLGQRNLQDILADRDAISAAILMNLDEGTASWGIKVERVEITDVRLPLLLQKAMAVEGEATREAKARVIAAEGEHLSSKALKEAADVIGESRFAIQLRYLHTLTTIAAESNKTINFPLPLVFISEITGGGWQRKNSSISDE